MRCFEIVVAAHSALATGCSVALEDVAGAADPSLPSAALVAGCPLLDDTDGPLGGVLGRAFLYTSPAGELRWLLTAARQRDSLPAPLSAFTAPAATSTEQRCGAVDGAWTIAPALDPDAEGAHFAALAPVSRADGAWLYVSRWVSDGTAERLDGFGIATLDATTARFTPRTRLLWTADRPSFGTTAVIAGDDVYTYGCRKGRGFASDCFVARAPFSRLDDETAYAYASGGGHWSARVDDAWPVVEASGEVSVAYDPGRARWLMAYAEPLGRYILLRTGLGPDGPWSAPLPFLRCALPVDDPQAFCAGVSLALELRDALVPEDVVLTYAPATFTAGALDHDERAYWTRLAHAPAPNALP
jgi:hypothetical protein